ncbi:MAG: Gfo/Idh/MocA family oxidoreductase [Verrucomicrobiota bacterium]
MNNISLVLVGLSAYGTGYARELIDQGNAHNARLAGIADPYAENNPYWPVLREHKIPRYDTFDEFIAKQQADLVVIASPIHLHCSQTCTALRAGLPVLCEKPVAGTIQEVHQMIAAREKSGKFTAIGYNWSFSKEIQALKHDVMAGLFGRPVRLKTIVLWRRSLTYFKRNNWAGKLRMPGGAWVLDSPVNNATAHYLHNMFYILGSAPDKSTLPAEVVAELYRANDIENYDTAGLRAKTHDDVDIMFITSHAVDQTTPIRCEFVFEQAKVEFKEGSGLRAIFNNGQVKEYVIPVHDQGFSKLWQCIDAVRNGGKPVCGLEGAMAQTLCMNGAQESMPAITSFPPAMVQRRQNEKGDEYVMATGLAETLQTCYASWKLPSECENPWAKAGRRVDLRAYAWYPGGKKP